MKTIIAFFALTFCALAYEGIEARNVYINNYHQTSFPRGTTVYYSRGCSQSPYPLYPNYYGGYAYPYVCAPYYGGGWWGGGGCWGGGWYGPRW